LTFHAREIVHPGIRNPMLTYSGPSPVSTTRASPFGRTERPKRSFFPGMVHVLWRCYGRCGGPLVRPSPRAGNIGRGTTPTNPATGSRRRFIRRFGGSAPFSRWCGYLARHFSLGPMIQVRVDRFQHHWRATPASTPDQPWTCKHASALEPKKRESRRFCAFPAQLRKIRH
jgi:hypothetical protein